jgi:hypothetical protein
MSKLFGGNKHKQYPSAARSEKIRRDTAVFLANGGKIREIDSTVFGDPFLLKYSNQSHLKKQETRRQRNAKSKA